MTGVYESVTGEWYVCEFCPYSTDSEGAIVRHYWVHHPEAEA